jgi:tetratricopeptide (TPR) repeat protein
VVQTKSFRPFFGYGSMSLWWQAGLLVILVFTAYLPALQGEFVWDDDSWTTGIAPLLDGLRGLRWMWLHVGALQQYYPLTGTTFWLDYQLWGFWTMPYHVENVLWHALAALLFWRLLVQLQVPGAWLASLLFALHPVMVESVAWITERKNVVSMVFFLASLLAYSRFAGWGKMAAADVPGEKTVGRSPDFFYRLSFFLFFCAMLAKTSAFSLPAVILLIGWWKKGRICWRTDVAPALRFVGLALALCVVTFWEERNKIGAEGMDFDATFAQRCLIAGHAFWFYLGKLIWPSNLCFIYPHWQPDPASIREWFYPLAALGVLFFVWLARGRIGRGLATALFFYAGTLFPVLGFMNAYGMRYSYVWDHWVYLSSLGVFALVAAGLASLADRLRKSSVAYGFATIVLSLLMVLSWQHAAMFINTETLWQKTLAVNPECPLALNNFSVLLYQRGDKDEAMEYCRKALQLKPNYYEARYNYGLCLMDTGHTNEAIESYRLAIQLYPNFPDALNSLGYALTAEKKTDEAIGKYQDAIRLNPYLAVAHYNLGMAFLAKGQIDRALPELRQVANLKPDFDAAFNDLANAVALNNEAWSLATNPDPGLRDGKRAVEIATIACEQTHYEQPLLVGTLAAAYAEAGRYNDAVSTGHKACALAESHGDTNRLERNQELVKLYQTHQPYHEPPTGAHGSTVH